MMNRRRPQSYLLKSWLPLKQNGFSNKRVKLVSSPMLRMITVPQDITIGSPLWDTEHSYVGTDTPSFHRLNRKVTVSHFTVWQHQMEGSKARFWKVSVTVSRVQNNKYSVEIAYHHPDLIGHIPLALDKHEGFFALKRYFMDVIREQRDRPVTPEWNSLAGYYLELFDEHTYRTKVMQYVWRAVYGNVCTTSV